MKISNLNKLTYVIYAAHLATIGWLLASLKTAAPKLPERIDVGFDVSFLGKFSISSEMLWFLALAPAFSILVTTVAAIMKPKLTNKNPSGVQDATMKQLLKLPLEKQQPYWNRFAEFLAAVSFSSSLIFVFFTYAVIQIGLGTIKQIPVVYPAGALGLLIVVEVIYILLLHNTAKRIFKENQ